jgi:hypothetical protein
MVKRRRVPEQVRDDEEAPAWCRDFFAGLIVTGSVREALGEARVDFETAWAWRGHYPLFAMYWDRAIRVHKAVAAGVPPGEAAEWEELVDIARVRAAREAIELDQMEELW